MIAAILAACVALLAIYAPDMTPHTVEMLGSILAYTSVPLALLGVLGFVLARFEADEDIKLELRTWATQLAMCSVALGAGAVILMASY